MSWSGARYLIGRLEGLPIRLTQLTHGLPVGRIWIIWMKAHWRRRYGRGGLSVRSATIIDCPCFHAFEKWVCCPQFHSDQLAATVVFNFGHQNALIIRYNAQINIFFGEYHNCS